MRLGGRFAGGRFAQTGAGRFRSVGSGPNGVNIPVNDNWFLRTGVIDPNGVWKDDVRPWFLATGRINPFGRWED